VTLTHQITGRHFPEDCTLC